MAKKETATKANNTVAAKATQKIARDILTANPGMNEVHVTSDGTAFFTRNDAQNHANTLKNREVTSYKRSALTDGTAEKDKVQNDSPAVPADQPTGEAVNDKTDKTEE